MIMETYVGNGSNSDILSDSSSRLNAMPYLADVSVEVVAQKCDNANHVKLTIREPGGQDPIDSQVVPASNNSDDLCLNDMEETVYTTQVLMGGHLVIGISVTGTSDWLVRVVAAEAG